MTVSKGILLVRIVIFLSLSCKCLSVHSPLLCWDVRKLFDRCFLTKLWNDLRSSKGTLVSTIGSSWTWQIGRFIKVFCGALKIWFHIACNTIRPCAWSYKGSLRSFILYELHLILIGQWLENSLRARHLVHERLRRWLNVMQEDWRLRHWAIALK